jgi:cytochrome P450
LQETKFLSIRFTDSIVNETIRYTSGVFMVRAITKDTSFEMENGEKFNLRAGDRVAMYPPAIHKDPEIFENPLVSFYSFHIWYCHIQNFHSDH